MADLGTIVDLLVVVAGLAVSIGCAGVAYGLEWSAKNYPADALDLLRRYGA